MNELEEAREAIAKILNDKSNYEIVSNIFGADNIKVDEWILNDKQVIDQILKLPCIAVLSKDQTPPISPEYYVSRAFLKANFKRVIDE